MKFKIFDDDSERDDSAHETTDYKLPLIVGLFMILIVGVILCKEGVICPEPPRPELDAITLCPVNKEDIRAKRDVLLDFSDSLTPPEREQAVRLVRNSTRTLGIDEMLSVSILQSDINAPRVEAAKFCNPIDKDQIASEVGKSIAVDSKTCNKVLDGNYSWPKRVSPKIRETIGQSCKNIRTMDEEIQGLIEEIPPSGGADQDNSFIVRGIEDIIFENRRMSEKTPKYLIIFSDMLQHADWFSQYKTKFPEWTIGNLSTARRNAAHILGEEPQNNFDQVRICYVQRKKILNLYAHQEQHREMWADYFKPVKVEEREYTACTTE